MNQAIQCNGLSLNGIFVPPFTLYEGDALCLEWPIPLYAPAHREFLDYLSGRKTTPHLIVNLPVCECQLISFYTETAILPGLYHLIYDYIPPAIDKLLYEWGLIHCYQDNGAERRKLDDASIARIKQTMREITQRYNYTSVLTYSGNDRSLLAFAECCKVAETIVFYSPQVEHDYVYGNMDKFSAGKTLLECRFQVLRPTNRPTYHNCPLLSVIKQ